MFLDEFLLEPSNGGDSMGEKDPRSSRLRAQQNRLLEKRRPESTLLQIHRNVHLPNMVCSPPKFLEEESALTPEVFKPTISTFDPDTEIVTNDIKEIICDDVKDEKGQGSGSSPTKSLTGIDLSDIRSFVFNPAPKGYIVQCQITRRKKGFKNRLYPVYELSLKENRKFLIAAKKRANNKTSNYIMSLSSKAIDRNDETSYIGKLRSNFVGTEFTIYDNGVNPKNASPRRIRKEMGAILFESNIFGSRGPRKMTVLLPTIEGSEPFVWRPTNTDDTMAANYKNGNRNHIYTLENRAPRWNDQIGAYVLNFSGRVTMASVKNFQLVEDQDSDKVVLQFGRVGKDSFTMDVQYPLSIFQAYAICLSSFDYKIACE